MDNAHIDTLLAGIETLTAEELDKQIKDIGEALAAKKAKIEKRKKEVADYKNGNLVTNKKSPLGGAWAAVLQSRKHKEESLEAFDNAVRKLRKQYVAALDEHVEGSKVIRENVKARAPRTRTNS